MGEMQGVRRSRARRLARSQRARSARVGRAERSPRRPSSSESRPVAGGSGSGDEPDVLSPQQRVALENLAYTYKALLQEAHPEYDWVVEILE